MKLSRITQLLVVGTALTFLTFQANAWQIGPSQDKSEKERSSSYEKDSKDKDSKDKKEKDKEKERDQEKEYKTNQQGDEGCIDLPKETDDDCAPGTNGGSHEEHPDCDTPTTRVPDGGSTVMLLGAALIALGTFPKRKS
jgi:hypothetical protein